MWKTLCKPKTKCHKPKKEVQHCELYLVLNLELQFYLFPLYCKQRTNSSLFNILSDLGLTRAADHSVQLLIINHKAPAAAVHPFPGITGSWRPCGKHIHPHTHVHSLIQGGLSNSYTHGQGRATCHKCRDRETAATAVVTKYPYKRTK